MLSEEGWTKARNWARRLLLLVVFAGLIAGAAAGAASVVLSRFAWSDLENYYLSSYLWAASPSVFSSTGTYTIVVVGAQPGREYLATRGDAVRRNGVFVVTEASRNRGATGAWTPGTPPVRRGPRTT